MRVGFIGTVRFFRKRIHLVSVPPSLPKTIIGLEQTFENFGGSSSVFFWHYETLFDSIEKVNLFHYSRCF